MNLDSKCAIIVVDAWNKHWDESVQEKMDEIGPQINKLLQQARAKNAVVIHCPSDLNLDNTDIHTTQPFFPPNYDRLKNQLTEMKFPMILNATGEKVWSAIHPSISTENDYITTSGEQVLNLLIKHEIENIYYLGQAGNICILYTREFSILAMKNNYEANYYLVKNLVGWLGENSQQGLDFYQQHICPTILWED